MMTLVEGFKDEGILDDEVDLFTIGLGRVGITISQEFLAAKRCYWQRVGQISPDINRLLQLS